MSNEELIAEARRLIADCATYKFGMRNADKLAHEVAGQLADALEAQSAPLVADSREAVRLAVHQGVMPRAMSLLPALGGVQGYYDAFLDDLTNAVTSVVSLAADRDRAVAERAWAEGHDAALWNAQWPQDRKSNPYRESEARND